MRRISLLAFGLALLTSVSQAQWTAFNDHVPSSSTTVTHSNATRIKIPSSAVPFTTTNGLLKNISSGADLPVTLTITRSANGTFYDGNGANPASGTPLYNNFNTFVDFGANPDCNVGIVSNMTGTITYTFSGLNPSKLYNFKGGAVRGNSSQTNRWTRVDLLSAASFVNAHTPHVLTSSQIGSLPSNAVAVTFGWNQAVTSGGDFVGWDSIDPGPDGTISIQCTHYTGSVTNPGSSSGTNGWAITGIRLDEIAVGPPQILNQPASQTVFAGDTYTFGVNAVGTPPLSYQWYKNNSPVGGNSSNYTSTAVYPADNGSLFKVVVSNSSGSTTSTPNATLTVSNARPFVVTQPQDQNVNAPATASFSVRANGNKPLSYQWYRNGSMIAGATSSNYTTAATSIADSGSKFSCLIMNSAGTTNSRDAVLTVTVLPQIVISYTNNWRYFTNGTDLGTAWQAPGYNDSSWPVGEAWLGHETDAAGVPPLLHTDLPFNGVGGVRIRTYYFRAHFNIGDPNAIMLVSSNYIDDGAVFYFNGHELNPRYNLNQAPSPINYQTLALAASAEGLTAIFTNVIPADFLVPGDNVVAVELHQVNDTSSDMDFGMGLTAFFLAPSPLAITSQPGDRTATETTSTTFSVGFSGTQPQFQWYKWVNDTPVAIPGAIARNYTITNVALTDAGFFFVVVSNALGSVASSPALLSVVTDLAGPTLVLADGSKAPTTVVVSYNEAVLPSTATVIANYKITNATLGGTLTISSAVLTNGTNVVLTSAARAADVNYLLIVNNVRDTSTHTNAIVPNSSIPISQTITLVGLELPGWDFYNPLPPFEPAYPGTNWNNLSWQFAPPINDPWGHGAAGLFVWDATGSEDLPANQNTLLSEGAISSYFRYIFQFNGSPLGATLRLRHIIDDGAVFYLNGTEVLRFNMPSGTFNELTPASSAIGIASSSDYIELPASLLRSGTNLLAAELHGIATDDEDLVFGAEIIATFSSYATGAVVITSGPNNVTAQEGSPVTFSVSGIAATSFQWRTNGIPIPGATNATYFIPAVPANWNGRMFSVVASNPGNSVTSSNALLTVLADTIAPVLLGAYGNTPTSITASFSEAISSATGNTAANYKVTNSAGVNLPVSAASLTAGGSNVVLTVNPMSIGPYTLIVNNLRDASTSANLIGSNSTATVGYVMSIPIDATWRFFTNNTDLSTGWRATGYNDMVSPWTNGPALIADETAALPEPIKTRISRLDGGNYHYTFYFRYHLMAPYAITGLPVTFRHVIDDGALFYLNGNQFHSFNMTNDASTVTYTTEASANVGDGVYNGPYTTNVNLVAGDNVIAVEVHQNGTASSDLTFGATFSGGIPSVANTMVTAPPLQISKSQGTNIVVTWPGTGFILEGKKILSPSALWVPLTNQGPVTLSPPQTTTNASSFYRLHR